MRRAEIHASTQLNIHERDNTKTRSAAAANKIVAKSAISERETVEMADKKPRIDRNELVRRLAMVSHATWMRQKERDQGVSAEELSPEVTDHDLERAEDAVRELEALNLWPPRD